jgi:glycogen debranching enzyme
MAKTPSDTPPDIVDAIHVLEGSTFMISDRRGDVPAGVAGGLFHEDTRFLSRYELRLNGTIPEILTSGEVDYYSAEFFTANVPTDQLDERSVLVQRHRFVGEGLHDDIYVHNHAGAPVKLELRLGLGADFADLFEVKDRREKEGTLSSSHDPEKGRLRFDYVHDLFRVATRIDFTQKPRIEGDDAVFDVELDAGKTWKTCVNVRLHEDRIERHPKYECESFFKSERAASTLLEKWSSGAPQLRSDYDLVELVFARSLLDLAALRLHAEVGGNEFSLPAAGLPWFMAIFGRDTLITSYQSLWVGPELAKGALIALSALQGTRENEFKDEQPGKILHEIRFGELTAIGEKPHRPYYGTCDATPLWLILLSEYWRFTGDDETVKALFENAVRALGWIDEYGDSDGDGFVEYKTKSSQGLGNQCWRDSWNGVQFADGRLAEAPIATCEIQGYVYDAKLRTAELAEKVWGDPAMADRLRREAKDLYERFNDRYWIKRRGGYYALALDKDKKLVDAKASDMGHLLWSGIVPEDRAPVVVKQLFSGDMFSGWGVRTLAASEAGYNPITYHGGTVWPHDNSIIAAGLARYGFREEANQIGMAMFEAARYTDYRLPEVFAGFARHQSRFPVRYPTACIPQAWATAAPFLWLRTFLGLAADDGQLTVDPAVPEKLGNLVIKGVHAFGRRYEVAGEGGLGEVVHMKEGAR